MPESIEYRQNYPLDPVEDVFVFRVRGVSAPATPAGQTPQSPAADAAEPSSREPRGVHPVFFQVLRVVEFELLDSFGSG